MSNTVLFFKDKPIFGLDLGFDSVKVMQITREGGKGKKPIINGYGSIKFDPKAVNEGIIVDYDIIAQAIHELFDQHIIGKINTRRVAATIPSAKAYSRSMTLPATLSPKEREEAVRYEAEQYIHLNMDELYVDYTMTNADKDAKNEINVVGVPKKIVDSYMTLMEILGLEVVALETTINSSSRLIAQAENSGEVPTILIDCGSLSVDLTIYDKVPLVNGTVPGGGDNFTDRIAEKLHVSQAEAHTIKTKYGLGVSKKQKEIREALSPQLDQLIREIRRVVRYYDDRMEGKRTIGQIITMGGGANMPGFSDYLTDALRIPTRMCDFWQNFGASKVRPPSDVHRSLYVTVAGASLIDPREVWG